MSEEYTARISEKELEKSYWFVTHVQKLRKEAHILLGVGVGIIYAILCWQIISLYVLEQSGIRSLILEAREALGKRQVISSATDLSVVKAGVVPSGEGYYDLYVSVGNVNDDWRAYFDVVFVMNGKALDAVKSFIYSGETKYVLKQSVKSQTQPNVQVRLENVRWHKMTKEAQTFLQERNHLSVDSIELMSETLPSSQKRVSKISFELKNESAFHFWETSVPIVVLSGNSVVALKALPIASLASGEKRKIVAYWNTELDTVAPFAYDIHPEADIFDLSAFKKRP